MWHDFDQTWLTEFGPGSTPGPCCIPPPAHQHHVLRQRGRSRPGFGRSRHRRDSLLGRPLVPPPCRSAEPQTAGGRCGNEAGSACNEVGPLLGPSGCRCGVAFGRHRVALGSLRGRFGIGVGAVWGWLRGRSEVDAGSAQDRSGVEPGASWGASWRRVRGRPWPPLGFRDALEPRSLPVVPLYN